MIERALKAGVAFAWVAADSIYGVGEVEKVLRRAGKGYVLGVTGAHQFRSWGKAPVAGTADEIAAGLPASAWMRLSAGDGTKGPRLYDWAYLELADLEAEEFDCPEPGIWTRGLLVRRSLSDAHLAFFSTWCPAGTSFAVLVGVEGRRWAIEDAFETAKNELGLDHHETRSPAPLSTAWLAPARLAGDARLRPADGDPPSGEHHPATPKKRGSRAVPPMVPWSVQEIRRLAGRLAQRRIEPASVIAWSIWRRCHQAMAQRAHLKRALQL
jgi:hypothetical protein